MKLNTKNKWSVKENINNGLPNSSKCLSNLNISSNPNFQLFLEDWE